MTTTLQNFGVPLGGGLGRGGMLQPKVKYKFRVVVYNFGPYSGGTELTQQVQSCTRPTVQSAPVAVHSFNSISYYASKPEWQSVELVVRDDVTNVVSKLVGHQEQKQMNHFQQTSPIAGSNYKFQMYIESLDGGNDAIVEQWFLEGCFLESINYDGHAYDSSDPMLITMTVRYDNATQSGEVMPTSPQIGFGYTIG